MQNLFSTEPKKGSSSVSRGKTFLGSVKKPFLECSLTEPDRRATLGYVPS